VSETTWRAWERGSKTPRLWRGCEIASALAIPTASLFTDEVVLAEVRLSDETIKEIKPDGAQRAESGSDV
jgi:DNA-binding XRE family transcriptional regulator